MGMLSRLRRDVRGTDKVVIDGLIGLIIVGILLMIVIPLYSSINSSMGTIAQTPIYNSTGSVTGYYDASLRIAQSNAVNNTGSAASIASIIPLVMVAGLIVAALVLGLYAVFIKSG